jgi:hypothetical protein
MLLNRICERIQREFPDARIVEIVEDLNDIQKDFCIETEILKTTGNLTIVANTITYTLLTAFSTLDKILRIDYLDSTGAFVDEEDSLKSDIKPDGTITFYDYYGDAITTISDTIATIKFYYTYTPAVLSSGTLSASPDIPSQLHQGLVHGVLAKYYSLFPAITKSFSDGSTAKVKDFQSAQFNEMKYREYVIKAKKLANMEKSELTIFTKADQF